VKDFPKDAWLAAIEALEGHGEIRIIEIIASAIVNERERCAGWHDHCAVMFKESDEPYSAWHRASAAAIRGTSSS
jgi:hypothetical protein